jgi:hypothetical protein
MPKIFNNNQTINFSDKSKSLDTMIDLARTFEERSTPHSKEISSILTATYRFLGSTDPMYQAARDKEIKDEKILELLNITGDALQSFYDNSKSINSETRDAFVYCCKAVMNRVKELKENDDKIFSYYNKNDNDLKKLLSNLAQQSRKNRR